MVAGMAAQGLGPGLGQRGLTQAGQGPAAAPVAAPDALRLAGPAPASLRLASTGKAQDEFLSEEERRWWNAPGDLLGGVGDRFALPGLSEAGSAARTPSSVARALGVAWKLVFAPGEFFGRFGRIFSNPIGVVGGLVDDIGALVRGVGSAVQLVGKTVSGGKKAASEIHQHGVVEGVRHLKDAAAAKAKGEAALVAKDLKEGVGVGARPMLKQLANAGRGAAEKAAKRAMMAELTHLAPQAFAKPSLFARATGFVGRSMGRVGDVAWALRGKADKLANAFAALLGRSKAGAGFLKLLDKLNPLSRLAQGSAQKTLAEAGAKGLEAATKATAEAMAKKGVTLGAAEAARLAASGEKAAAGALARVGTKASGQGIARFLPLLNVAMAAYDTYHCVRVWQDPKASGWKKGWATVTAACSWLTVTNLPVLSQVGAVGAILGSVLQGLTPEGIAGGAKAVGGFFARAGKSLWGGVKGLFGG